MYLYKFYHGLSTVLVAAYSQEHARCLAEHELRTEGLLDPNEETFFASQKELPNQGLDPKIISLSKG